MLLAILYPPAALVAQREVHDNTVASAPEAILNEQFLVKNGSQRQEWKLDGGDPVHFAALVVGAF
jgi:hypothetical protein